MPYLEPGAYVSVKSNFKGSVGYTPSLIPLLIGSGADTTVRTEVIKRGTDSTKDKLPVKALSILSVGYTENKNDFISNVDYKLSEDGTEIEWLGLPEKLTTKAPKEGEQYTIKFVCDVDESQYLPATIYSQSDVKRFGDEVNEKGEINRIVVALNIMLELGVTPIHVIQIKPNAKSHKVTSVEYKEALEKYAQFINTVWRIIPVDVDSDINGVIDSHVKAMSSWQERLERCAIYSLPDKPFLSFAEVLKDIGGYAESKQNQRSCVVYPNLATRMLSDGKYHTLDGAFIATAVAALEATMPVQQSKTRARLSCFKELLGVPMLRSQKNSLAEKGVLILEQPNGAGTDIIIRHQVSTDMSTAQTREISILGVTDFCTKYFRSIAENYIGKYNITPDTISRIKGALNSGIANLKLDEVIIDAQINSIKQDVNNPDTVLIEMQIKPAYPCNYIKITLLVD